MRLTQKQAEAIFFEEGQIYVEGDERMTLVFEVVEEGDWEDMGKYSMRHDVFSFDGRFFWLEVTRRGSAFTDYDFDFDLDCPEVEVVKVTAEVWKEVK
jgi:hypothetical protein